MALGAPPGPITVLRGHVADVQALAFHPTLNILYAGDITGELKSWNPAFRRPTSSSRIGESVLGIACLPHATGTVLICQGRNGAFFFLDLPADGLLTNSTQRAAFCTGAYTFCRMAALAAAPSSSPADTASSSAPSSSSASGPELDASSDRPPPGTGATSSPYTASAVSTHSPAGASALSAPLSSAAPTAVSAAEPACLSREGAEDDGDGEEHSGCTASRQAKATSAGATGGSRNATGDAVGLVACPGEDPGRVEIWGIQEGRCLLVLQPPQEESKWGMCMSLDLSRRLGVDAPLLAAGYEDGRLAVWRLALRQPAASSGSTGQGSSGEVKRGGLQPPVLRKPLFSTKLHNEPLMALALNPTGSGGISGSAETTVVCFEIDHDGSAVLPVRTVEMPKEGLSDLAVRKDGRLWVAAGWDGRLRVFASKTGKALAILKYHTTAATAVTFSSTGLLASASRDGTIALWSIYR